MVTDATKESYLRRWLHHKLVGCIAQQAASFRLGVEAVVAIDGLRRLGAAQLQLLWGGDVLGDEQLAVWRARWSVSATAAPLRSITVLVLIVVP